MQFATKLQIIPGASAPWDVEIDKELIKKAYRNKEFLTKDEYLYVICNFNPDSDSPLVLMSYVEQYNEYMKEISN